jgi:hypothetical protein
MLDNPLKSLSDYSNYIFKLLERPNVDRSTISVWSTSPYTGVAEGEVFFKQDYRLRLREELDFYDRLITAYGYEVYHNEERLYWYDDFPHPNHPTLGSTFPHHKHVQPDIKHNRIPAPEMSYLYPNIAVIVEEIEEMIESDEE